MYTAMQLILASASPRRKEILAGICPAFAVETAACEERAPAHLPPPRYARELARAKARDVASRHEGAAVLGADTVVALGGRILGKPAGEAEAKATLRALSGRKHAVYTGWCLLCGGKEYGGTCKTTVFFHELSDAFIDAYVATGSPMDKAGSYGIQDDARLVRSFRGSYTNVVGLPAEAIAKCLTKIGILP